VFDLETKNLAGSFSCESQPLSVTVRELPHSDQSRVFVGTDSGAVLIFSGETFHHLYSIKTSSPINGATFTSKGHLVVSEYINHTITVLQGETGPSFCDDPKIVLKVIRVIGTPGMSGDGNEQFCHPSGVAVNTRGHIIVADQFNHCMKVFDSVENGCKFLRKIGGYGSTPRLLDYPVGVAVDKKNNVLVADQNNHRIQIFREDGSFLHAFGKHGKGPGEFEYPCGIAFHTLTELVYVSEFGGKRVQVF